MELKIFIVLFCALFTGGHSLRCYKCLSNMDSCENIEVCPATDNTCVSATNVETTGVTAVKSHSKGCTVTDACKSTSVNFGFYRSTMSTQCCNTDLCNDKYAPDPSNSPNGKQCYSCDGLNCFNKLDCLGDEDRCFTATHTEGSVSQTVKGCASKSFCDFTSQYPPGYTSFSCCQGDLCDSAMSIKQNLLFLLCPLFFYILIH